MFGAPGSGKGTQSDNIVNKYNLMHISSGELLRNEIRNNTPVGKQVEEIIAKGHLVSDEIIIELLESKLNDLQGHKGIIFDGFPRTVHQAIMLDKMLEAKGEHIDVILNLDVEETTLIERLMSRGLKSGRADDNLVTIKNRLEIYNLVTIPILEYYKDREGYVRINNNTTMAACFDQVVESIDKAIA